MEKRYGLIFHHDPEIDVNGLLETRREIINRANTFGQFVRELDPNQQGIDNEVAENTKALVKKGIIVTGTPRDSWISRIKRSIG